MPLGIYGQDAQINEEKRTATLLLDCLCAAPFLRHMLSRTEAPGPDVVSGPPPVWCIVKALHPAFIHLISLLIILAFLLAMLHIQNIHSTHAWLKLQLYCVHSGTYSILDYHIKVWEKKMNKRGKVMAYAAQTGHHLQRLTVGLCLKVMECAWKSAILVIGVAATWNTVWPTWLLKLFLSLGEWLCWHQHILVTKWCKYITHCSPAHVLNKQWGQLGPLPP